MDNNEDIIIPKKSSKTPTVSDSSASVVRKEVNKPLLLTLIIAGVFIIVLVVAVIILLNRNQGSSDNNPSSEDTGQIVEVETIYTTPDGVEDAEAAYSEWLEEQKESAETPEAVFDADMQIISNEISQENYDKALGLLDAISRDDLDTTQLFRLYNIYTRVYEGNGDTEKYDEYVDLRTEQLNFLTDSEE